MRNIVLCVLCFVTVGFALERQPAQDYRARRVALSNKTSGGIVVLFAGTEFEAPEALTGFQQNRNFFYLTGWAEPGAALVIAPAVTRDEKDRDKDKEKDRQPSRAYEEILFLPSHNQTQEKWTGPRLGPDDPQAAAIAGVDRVEPLDKLRDELVRLLPVPRATVYTDLAAWDETSTATAPLRWLQRANAFNDHTTFVDVKPLVAGLRVIKDAGEMALIQHAVDASVEAHLAAMKAIRPGMSEREIAALMQYEYERRGCERPAYSPIVGAGWNGTVLHYSENSGTAQAGDVIVIDVAGEYSGYASDITRTLPATGKFTPRQRELYNVVLGAQEAAFQAFREGKQVIDPRADNSLFKVAYDYINSHGSDLHGQPLGKYFIHGLTHYVGLEVHDAGDNNLPLEKGMVFTIEPGIYIPEEKIGIRIEDMFWVDPNGKLVRLTQNLPRTAEEVEQTMAQHQESRDGAKR